MNLRDSTLLRSPWFWAGAVLPTLPFFLWWLPRGLDTMRADTFGWGGITVLFSWLAALLVTLAGVALITLLTPRTMRSDLLLGSGFALGVAVLLLAAVCSV